MPKGIGRHYKKLVYGVGANDVPLSCLPNTYTYRVYKVWINMLNRCYSKASLKRSPTYKDCFVCERWTKFSNFLEDVPNIQGYALWLNNPNKSICLDKDILNGHSKEYCLKNCCFVTRSENSREAMIRNLDVANTKKKIICTDEQGNETTYNSIRECARTTIFSITGIWHCLKGHYKHHRNCKFRYA